MAREVDKFKATADIVHHLDWHGEYKRYYTLRKEYTQYLSGMFPVMRTTNWGGIVELINSNRFFFSLYGIESDVNLGGIYYRGIRVYF